MRGLLRTLSQHPWQNFFPISIASTVVQQTTVVYISSKRINVLLIKCFVMDAWNAAGAASAPKKKRGLLDILILVVGAIVVLSVLYLLRQAAIADHIKVGAIVQATTTGNPAMVTTAFSGLRGEDAWNLSKQDQANLQSCDVPGAVGFLHSSWASNGGVAWANPADLSICLSASRYPFDSQTCSHAEDCFVIRHLPCGSGVKDGNGKTTWDTGNPNAPWSTFQCGGQTTSEGTPATICSFTDATSVSGFCMYTTDGAAALGVTCLSNGKCHFSNTENPGAPFASGAACPFVTCTTSNGSTPIAAPGPTECFEGQMCSYSSGVTDVMPAGGFCVGEPLPHLSINVPIVVEGTVSKANSDGTFDVFWTHARLAYNLQGPAVGWNYQTCVVTPSSDPINAAARAILFGSGGSWTEGADVTDPQGFVNVVGTIPKFTLKWQDALTGGTDSGGNPTAQQLTSFAPVNHAIVPPGSQSVAYSAWNLQSENVPKDVLTRITEHSILPTPPTTDTLAKYASQWSISSNTWIAELAQEEGPYF
jgi:hypothetical protein